MTIKEAEAQTGLSRSNIRFYEKEKLIEPKRRESNGYREYSTEDVENIKKIAYLRTLGFSIDDIRAVMEERVSLKKALMQQAKALDNQMEELKKARAICEQMLRVEPVSYKELDITRYVPDVEEHWQENERIMRKDTVGFFYLWGGILTWGALTLVSLILALAALPFLPKEIPVQWSSDGVPTNTVPGYGFLLYPLVCIAIRLLLRPFIWRALWVHGLCADGDGMANFISNYVCFVLITLELFTIANVNGCPVRVTTVLLADAAVFLLLWLAAKGGRFGKRGEKGVEG